MSESVWLLLGAALANNLVLSQTLAASPLLGATTPVGIAWRVARVSAAVAFVTGVFAFALQRLLLEPAGLEHLRLLFVALLAALLTQGVLHRSRALDAVGDATGSVPITINAAVIAMLALPPDPAAGWLEAITLGAGHALGFLLVLPMFAAMRERFEGDQVPESFRGAPIALLSAGLLALAFMGLAGIGAR